MSPREPIRGLGLLVALACVAATPTWTVVGKHPNGEIARATLSVDTPLGPVVGQKGSDFGRHPNGKLSFCTVAAPTLVDGVPIAKGAYTLFHPNERVWQTTVSKALTFTPGKVTVACAANQLVTFYDDGTFDYCQLDKPLTVGGVVCSVGHGVAFSHAGKLQAATLGAPYAALGVTFPKDTWLSFDDAGQVVGGTIMDALVVRGLSITYDFKAHGNGKLAEVVLAAATTVQGHAFPERAKLAFRADGTLEKSQFVEKQGFMIHGEEWHDTRHTTYDAKGAVVTSWVDHWQSDVPKPVYKPKKP